MYGITKFRKGGFSLIELLVSMAIIAVLLGLVGFGIATAQRNGRDSQRRQKVADVRIALTDFQTRHNRYPTRANIEMAQNQITLRAFAADPNPIILRFDGPTLAGSATEPGQTLYCYQQTADGGYLLGALLENGQWFDVSESLTAGATCEANSGAQLVP